MPHPIAVRLLDAILGFLLRPRVRRVRRWSFLAAVPLGFLVGRSVGLGLGDGFAVGIAAALLDAAVRSAWRSPAPGCSAARLLGCSAARLLGEERRDAVLDLLMHPVARRAIVGEARMLATFPVALLGRLRPARGERFACHRGSHELALAPAPAMQAEPSRATSCFPRAGSGRGRRRRAARLRRARAAVVGGPRAHAPAPARRRRARAPRRAALFGRASWLRASRRSRSRGGAPGSGPASCWGEDAPRLAVSGRTDVILRFAAPIPIERPLAPADLAEALA